MLRANSRLDPDRRLSRLSRLSLFRDVLRFDLSGLDRGKVIIDPTRFVADPEKAKSFPELPYVTVRLG